MKTNLYIFSLMLFLVACKGNYTEIETGYDYAPIAIGNYRIYDATRILYSGSDTTYEDFQIKEVVKDTFTINGEFRYRLERFERLVNTDPWPATPDSVWTAHLSSSRLIRVENNIRYIKLVFPVENGRSWNGNVENNIGSNTYQLTSVGNGYTVNGSSYAKTAKVIQSPNDSNKVNKDYRMEVFAKDIGLIHKVQETYEYQQGGSFGQYKIESGIKYYEKLNSYGSE